MTTRHDDLTILGWNCRRPPRRDKNGKSTEGYERSGQNVVDELNAWLLRYRPHVVGLVEAAAYHSWLRDKVPGYRLLVFPDKGRAGDNAILVRKDLQHGLGFDIEAPESSFWWTAATGRKSYSRAHVTAKIGWLRFTVGHFVPGVNFARDGSASGPRLRVGVYSTQLWLLTRHIKAFLRDPAHYVWADWNEGDADHGPSSPGGWARRLGLAIVKAAGLRIDWGVVRGATVVSQHVIAVGQQGNKSDHPAHLVTLRRK